MPEHPEITFRKDALLCSINERLGFLVWGMCDSRTAGQDIPPLGTDYLEELGLFNDANVEDVEEAIEESKDGER